MTGDAVVNGGSPTQAEQALATAWSLLDAGRWRESLDTLRPAMASPDTAYEACCLSAYCLLCTGQRALASGVVQFALAARPDGEWAHRLLASILLKDGRRAAALHAAEQAARLRPQSVLALYMLAKCQVAAYRHAEAQRTAQAAVTASPEDPLAYQALAEAARAQFHNDEAAAACQAGLAVDPQNESLLLGLGEVFDRQQHHLEAAEAYLAAARVNPFSNAPVRGLSHVWQFLQSSVRTWQRQGPSRDTWDALTENCPAPVSAACSQFWQVTAQAREEVETGLGRALDILGSALRSRGVRLREWPETGSRLDRWGGEALMSRRHLKLDWYVLGLDKPPVRGHPGRVSNGASMLKFAGERAAGFAANFAAVATASTGLRVPGGDGADFHQTIVDIHAGVTGLSASYLACATALADLAEAMTSATRQTEDALQWAERTTQRVPRRVGSDADAADVLALRADTARRQDPRAVSALRQAAAEQEAVGSQQRGAAEQAARARQAAALQEAAREWEDERQAAVTSGRLALSALSEAEARCAEAVRAATPGAPGPLPGPLPSTAIADEAGAGHVSSDGAGDRESSVAAQWRQWGDSLAR